MPACLLVFSGAVYANSNWDEIDKQMLQAGVYSVFNPVAELENEEMRYLSLYHAINDKDTRKLYWFHDETKELIRKSRKLYGDSVPDDEFFGM